MARMKLVGLVVVLTAAVAIAGCGSSSSKSSSAAASAGTTGSGSSGSSSSGSPITILFVGDQTGPTKSTGLEQLGGVKASIHYWNAHGGFAGHQAKLVVVNDNGNPATAVSSTIKYLDSNPKPTMIWAGTEGTEIAAMIPLVKSKGLYGMAVNDGNLQCLKNAQSSCPTFFSIGGGLSATADAAAAKFKKLGVKKVGILAESLSFTQSETPSFEAALTKLGISYKLVSFPATAVDLTSEVSELKSDGVTGVEAELYGPAVGYALSARQKLGWNAPVVLDAAGSSFDVSKLVSSQSQLKNTYVNIAPPTNGCLNIKGVKLLVAQAKAAGATIGTLPLYVASFGWDGGVLLKNALSAAGSTDPTKLAAASEKLSTSAQNDPLLTLEKRMAFSADDHENIGVTGSDYQVVPAGPLVGGQLHPGCSS